MWQAKTGTLSARARNYAIGGALCVAVVVILAMLGTIRPGGPSSTGTAGCAALSDPHQVSPLRYQRIRAQFSGAQWSDLRLAGTSYIDLLVALRRARGTDEYEAVWFYQRLARACARHAKKTLMPGQPAGGATAPGHHGQHACVGGRQVCRGWPSPPGTTCTRPCA